MKKDWAIIANGLLLKHEDVRAVAEAEIPIIAIAAAYRIAPNAIACYASDGLWWGHHLPLLEKSGFQGDLVTQEASTAAINAKRGLQWVEHDGSVRGLPDRRGVVAGSSSGHHVLCYAYWRGFTDMILLGYEYGAAGDGHWFGSHPQHIARPSHWPTMIRDMGPLAVGLAQRGVEVINCTNPTALNCFRTDELSNVLEQYKRTTAKTHRRSRQEAAE